MAIGDISSWKSSGDDGPCWCYRHDYSIYRNCRHDCEKIAITCITTQARHDCEKVGITGLELASQDRSR